MDILLCTDYTSSRSLYSANERYRPAVLLVLFAYNCYCCIYLPIMTCDHAQTSKDLALPPGPRFLDEDHPVCAPPPPHNIPLALAERFIELRGERRIFTQQHQRTCPAGTSTHSWVSVPRIKQSSTVSSEKSGMVMGRRGSLASRTSAIPATATLCCR